MFEINLVKQTKFFLSIGNLIRLHLLRAQFFSINLYTAHRKRLKEWRIEGQQRIIWQHFRQNERNWAKMGIVYAVSDSQLLTLVKKKYKDHEMFCYAEN